MQKKQKGDEEPTEAARVRQVLDPGVGLKPSKRVQVKRAEERKAGVRRKRRG